MHRYGCRKPVTNSSGLPTVIAYSGSIGKSSRSLLKAWISTYGLNALEIDTEEGVRGSKQQLMERAPLKAEVIVDSKVNKRA